jgi:hypothetical protein
LGAEKGAEKSLGRGRGCVFGSSPKWLEQPHPELVAAGSLRPYSPDIETNTIMPWPVQHMFVE